MSEVKSFVLTGGAMEGLLGGKLKKRQTRKKKLDGGFYEDTPSTFNVSKHTGGMVYPSPLPSASPSLPSAPAPTPSPLPSASAPTPSPLPSASTPTSHGGGDVKQISVKLKKKLTATKVRLHQKKTKKNVTKHSKKIVLGVSALHKRITRARKTTRKMKEMPLAKLKELLISKKLIKSTSKAPESVLRQIATDSKLIGGNML
jgi:hypothetical protein